MTALRDVVRVEWWGHSCFVVRWDREDAPTITVLFDPVSADKGRPEFDLRADVALISHPHKDHASVPEAGAGVVVRGVSDDGQQWRRTNLKLRGLAVTGIATYHDPMLGALKGKNMAFIVRFGEKRIAHLGDIGHKPSSEQMQQLSGVDVLMLPCNGERAITAEQAVDIAQESGARIVIPMDGDEAAMAVFGSRFDCRDVAGVQEIPEITSGTSVWLYRWDD